MKGLFEVAAGSVRGRDHVRTGKNNQDAFAWKFVEEGLVAVVTDGCGTSDRSEVGAHVGARLFVEACSDELPGFEAQGEAAWDAVRRRMLWTLRRIAALFGGDVDEVVHDFFLFTVLGAVVTPSTTWVVAAGDGVAFVNGKRLRLGPFPGNAPPYLAYGLVEGQRVAPRLEILARVPTGEIDSLFLGTDGAEDLLEGWHRRLPGKDELFGPVEQFWKDDRFFGNADQVRRKLALASREVLRVDPSGQPRLECGLLSDDTTLVALRPRRVR